MGERPAIGHANGEAIGAADETVTVRQAEEARRAAVAELEAVLEAVPAIVFIARDCEGRRIEGNRAAREFLRTPAGANLSLSAPGGDGPRHFRVVMDGREMPPAELPVQKAAARGIELRDVSLDLHFDDGSVHRLFGNVAPLFDAGGRPAGAVAAFLDVTARQRAADRIALLSRVNDRLAAAGTPAEVAEAVLRDGMSLMGAQTAIVRIFVSPEELGVLHAVGVPEAVLATMQRRRIDEPSPITDAVRTGQPVWLPTPDAIRARYPHMAGMLDVVPSGAWASFPLLAGGCCVGSIGLTFAEPQAFPEEDRTFLLMLASKCARALERAMLHEESRRQRALLDTIFAVDPGGIAVIAERAGEPPRIVMANPAYRALTPDPALDPIGRTVEEVWPSSRTGEAPAEELRRILAAGATSGHLTVGVGLGARHLLYHTRAIPWSDGAAAVVVLWDVTRMQALQEQREDMLRMISHDLRTPLNALVLQSGMLQRAFEPSDPRAGRAAKVIANAMRMDRMIRDLVEMTLLEGGQVALTREVIDFGEYARQVVERLEEPDRIRVAVDDGLPRVSLDRDRFERVLVNLLDNALKYSPPSEEVVLAAEAAAGGISIRVADRGVGIPKDDLPRVFDRFFRTKDARRKEGLGLGLYIAALLVRAHGGGIEVDSEPGRGCTFRVHLPVG